MLEGEIQKAESFSASKKTKKMVLAGAFGLSASTLAGFLVWSINGRFEKITHWDNGYGTSGDTITVTSVDPATQGFLAFLMVGLLIITAALLLSSAKDN
jgi:hypothetical protein